MLHNGKLFFSLIQHSKNEKFLKRNGKTLQFFMISILKSKKINNF